MNTHHRLPKSTQLWIELLNQNPTNEDLCKIVESCEPLQVRAAKKLLERMPTNPQLCSIIKHVSVLKVSAAHMLMKQKSSDADLRLIMEHVDTLFGQAERKLTRRPRTTILADIFSMLRGQNQQQS